MKELTCIVCPNSCSIRVEIKESGLEVTGNLCPRGKTFAINEIENPKRSVTTTVKTIYKELPRMPVKTHGEIPKKNIMDLMEILNHVTIDKVMESGEVVVENVLDSGVDIVCTCDMNLWIKAV